MEGTTILRLKNPLRVGVSVSNLMGFCFFNFKAKKKEHRARTTQVRKRVVKPYPLIINIPATGAMAVVKIGANVK
jgi:hypothetical protein